VTVLCAIGLLPIHLISPPDNEIIASAAIRRQLKQMQTIELFRLLQLGQPPPGST
jgi:hypothetical protein